MKFICDAHISYKLKNFLSSRGHFAIHVNEILNGAQTKDVELCSYADANDLIIITKDFDFVDFYYVRKSPKKLIKINLGNLSTNELIKKVSEALPFIEKANELKNFLLEIDKNQFYLADDKLNT
jgi:predicted nuclease of predicted toxin-antitoxin system